MSVGGNWAELGGTGRVGDKTKPILPSSYSALLTSDDALPRSSGWVGVHGGSLRDSLQLFDAEEGWEGEASDGEMLKGIKAGIKGGISMDGFL